MFTIGIKRRWFFGYRKYSCRNFYFNGAVLLTSGMTGLTVGVRDIKVQLVLELVGGGSIMIANIENLEWKIYGV